MPATATGLIGRDEELRRLVAALEAAGRGEGTPLVVHGEAGIGKSALLAAARGEAERRGMRVLGAAGIETEADIPFAGLTSLLGPVLELRERLPAAQRAALEGALALAPSGPQPQFAVGAASAGLLAAAAEEAPLAVLLDDVHWLDGESLEAVLFAARRLRRDPVAFLFATRPPAELAGPGPDRLELSRLAAADAEELLRRQLPERAPAETLAELAAAADGNPLALIELPRGLGSDAAVEAPALPLRAGAAVEATFGAQLEALAPPVRLALTALAAERDPAPEPLALALAELGAGEAELTAAAAAGFVAARAGEGVPRFRHPLVRSAAYHGAAPAERRRAHAALAAAHLAAGQPLDAAWHRAAAATEPDAELAELLEEAAAEARTRGALSSAAQAARRAAELTPDPAERARRFVVAVGDLARTAHPERAVELAAAVAEDCADPLARADLQRLRGEVMIRLGTFEPAVELLAAEADRVAPLDRVRAARTLLSMSVRYRASGDYRAMAAAAERARELAAGEDAAVALFADVVLAHVFVVSGRRAEGEALLAAREPELSSPPPGATPELLTSPAHASLWAERPDRAERLTAAAVADARARSAPAALPFPLGIRAQLRFREGRWREALADGEEALELARDTGQLALVAFAAGALAEVEAASGREADARAHVESALEIVGPSGSEAIGIYAQTALGLLELGQGRVEAAVAALAYCREGARRMGMVEASVAHWAGGLVEALDRAGAERELEALVAELETAAAATGGAYAAAAAARGRGLLAGGEEFAAPLERSVEIFDAAGMPFERSRSQLALGERLRRARRRRQARPPLEAALAELRRLGARPWEERARAELAAAGGQGLEASPARAEELTAAELRVALLAAAGRSNPEIAAELLVSRRTVEHQLSAVYRKLGLRSRTQLAAALAE
jgi:DNA-binding CsgD family transcriptional regulator